MENQKWVLSRVVGFTFYRDNCGLKPGEYISNWSDQGQGSGLRAVFQQEIMRLLLKKCPEDVGTRWSWREKWVIGQM